MGTDWRYSLPRTPFLLIRTPLMLVGLVLIWAGEHFYDLGERIPGWSRN